MPSPPSVPPGSSRSSCAIEARQRRRGPSAQRMTDEFQHVPLDRMRATIGCRDMPAGADDEARRRAAGKPAKAIDRGLGAALSVELADATLESVEDLVAREDREEAVPIQEIDQKTALGRLDSAISAGDKRGRGDHRVEQLVIAVVEIL